jgi:proline iminopeptidase
MTPDEYTNQELMLEVGDGHILYVHDWGKKDAKNPIVALHGGPGYGFSDKHRRRFDPKKQRVIFHDQRGVGKSTPKGSLEHNTTEDLVEDVEKIAKKLNLKSFIVTGGSWGTTLALAYTTSIQHRQKCCPGCCQGN